MACALTSGGMQPARLVAIAIAEQGLTHLAALIVSPTQLLCGLLLQGLLDEPLGAQLEQQPERIAQAFDACTQQLIHLLVYSLT